MNNRSQTHFFWGPHAPLSTLAGAGIIIMSSARLAHAIFASGAIIWVYVLTSLVFFSAQKIMPKKGKFMVLLFLSSFICSIYLFLTGLLNPLLVSGAWFFIVLIPPCCIGSFLVTGLDSQDIGQMCRRFFLEAIVFSALSIAVSLIREPLGLASLSVPGGVWGIYEVFSVSESNTGFLPIQIFSVSSGGLIILGFAAAIFRHFQKEQSNGVEKS